MCTVTYLPVGNQFILTSNRDEKASRGDVIFPSFENGILFPKDSHGGGSWIATNAKRTICLLNGGMEPHVSDQNYRKSRGLVLLDGLLASRPKSFAKEYDFSGIEPFTMVIVCKEPYLELYELIWDGENAFFSIEDGAKSHIWSSVSLYDDDARLQRRQWFRQWEKTHPYTVSSILDFHKSGNEKDNYNGIRMNRDGDLKTLSITQVRSLGHGVEMTYDNLQGHPAKAELEYECEKI